MEKEKINIKNNLIGIGKLIIFALIFAFLFVQLSYIFVPKGDDDATGMSINITHSYRAEEENSIDVVFIGNSDVYRAINPVIIWEDCEITSCVVGMPNMSPGDAYNELTTLFQLQSPKVVVFEADCMFSTINKFSGKGKLKKENKRNLIETVQYGLDNLNSKFDGIDDALLSAISYRFPLMKYKDRWKKLKTTDFTNTNGRFKYNAKGYVYDKKKVAFDYGDVYLGKNDGSTEEFDKNVERDMKKIIELCNENNVKLTLLAVPSGTSWNWKKHNKVDEYAKSNNLSFVDYNTDIDVLDGFNWKKDTKDGGNHLNNNGAIKVTKAYEAVLTNEFGLGPSKLTPAQTESWNTDIEKYYKKISS